jgi:hypothetical protein
MRLVKSVLTVTACCLLATFGAATRPQNKNLIQAQGREVASASDILSPDDFIACTEKLVAGLDAYNSDTAMEDMLGAEIFSNNDEFYQATKNIFTRTYCKDTVDYIYDLSGNYTQRYGLCDWTCMARR